MSDQRFPSLFSPRTRTEQPEPAAQGGSPAGAARRWFWVVAAGLALALVLTYWPALRGPLAPSDRGSTLQVGLVSHYRNIPGLFTRDFLMFSDGQFRPLGYAVLAAVRTAVPADARLFWHLWLLGFHWLAAVLLFVLVRRLLGRVLPAALAAGLYALHPLASVVVLDVNQFHLLLGMVFYLGALVCYVRPGRTTRGAQAAAFALFLAGIFTSKVVFTLPVLLVAYEVFYRRSGIGWALLRLSPYGVAAAFLWPFWWVWRAHPLHYRYHPFPEGAAWSSLAHTLAALGTYARGLLLGLGLPAGLMELVAEPGGWGDWRVLVGAAGVVLLAAATLGALARRSLLLGLGLGLLILGLVPFASVAWNQVPEPLTWSNLLVPSAGLALAAAAVVAGLLRRWPGKGRLLVAALAAAAVAGLAAETAGLSADWRDPARYWERALRLNPRSARASVALGKVYLGRGEQERALEYLFAPPVTNLNESAAAMALYYARHDEPLAALVQLRAVASTVSGIVYGRASVRAQVMELLGAPDYAEAAWGKLLVGNPFNTEGIKQVARVLNTKGFTRAARRLLRHALRIDPNDPQALTLLAQVRAREESLTAPPLPKPPPPDWLMFALSGEASVPLRRQIVQLGRRLPADPLVQAEAATILLAEGEPAAALEAIDRTVERLPRIGTFWAIKALALDLSGDPSGAAQAAREALDLTAYATDLPVLFNLVGVVMLNRATNPTINDPGALEQAIDAFQAALEAGRELAQAHANLGLALARKGLTEEALRHLRRAVAMAPTDTRSHIMLASVLAQTGDYPGARNFYQQALAIDSTSVRAHLGLADLLAQTDDLEGAASQYQQVLKLNPKQPEALNGMGLLAAGQGRLPEAVRYFRRALQEDRYNDEVRFNLVEALQRQGLHGEAVQELRNHVARTRSPAAGTRLAWLLATSPQEGIRRGDEAVRLAEELRRQARHQDPATLQVLAAAYAETGRFEEAADLARQAIRLAQAAGNQALASTLAQQLQHYEAGQPLRIPAPPSPAPTPARPLPPG